VQAIRRYASRELALPDNGSYTRFADLGRPFVVWNVFAAPELALTPRQWCFRWPAASTTAGTSPRPTRGRGGAPGGGRRRRPRRRRAAYSTLGYFDDPVLSTFIAYREPDLARLVFHELAHQVVYVKDDTAFNESFAVAVEEEGLKRWLAGSRAPDAGAFAAHVARGDRLRAEFRALVRRTRERLAALYASDAPDADKRAGKAAALAGMRAEYAALKAGWDGAPAFDRWFAGGANNAGSPRRALYRSPAAVPGAARGRGR